ncbi:MAG TPA: DUF3352 domain-containing protein, partial [Solirubrobacteraceae bacterium]|nr:DUF3352 domain-containing protein [Solirubrobacteraceae bacterium]
MPRPAPHRLVALVLALAALVVAGCGGGGGGGGDEGADPADVAPRNSLVWIVGEVRPEGDRKDAVDAVAKKVLGVSDPGQRIQQLIDKSIRESGSKLTFKDDIEPWLGRRVGVAVTSLGSGGSDTQAAMIVAAKDTDKAKDAVSKLADEEKPKAAKREYQGVEYRLDADDKSAAGVVEDYVVFGTEPSFKAVVDASKGDGLSDNRQYSEAAKRGEGKLGFAFVDTRALVGALGASGQIPGGGQSLQSLLGAANRPATATLEASATNVTLETAAGATQQARTAKPNALVPDLPGNAWLALGLPNLGQTIRQTLAQISSGVGAGLVETAQQQIRAVTGLDLNRDILASLGELAVFAQGSSVLTAGGGVVIQTPDPAAARRLLSRLGPLIQQQARGAVQVGAANVAGARGLRLSIPRVPGAINAVLRGDRLVIAYTDAATRQALAPQRKLSDSPEFQRATQSLGGGQPALFLAFAPLAQVVAAASPEKAQQIRQYLGAFTTLAAGTRVQGNEQIGRF